MKKCQTQITTPTPNVSGASHDDRNHDDDDVNAAAAADNGGALVLSELNRRSSRLGLHIPMEEKNKN